MLNSEKDEIESMVEAAMAIAKKHGPTTPESRAILIGACVQAVCGKSHTVVNHTPSPTPQSPPRIPRLRG